MYIKDGIAYAGEEPKLLKIIGLRPLENFLLWIRFNTGEVKIFDFKTVLDDKCFEPLRDEAVFRTVYLDCNCPNWLDGDIDIAPEYLYENSVLVEEPKAV